VNVKWAFFGSPGVFSTPDMLFDVINVSAPKKDVMQQHRRHFISHHGRRTLEGSFCPVGTGIDSTH
jgi:hypothetical protein